MKKSFLKIVSLILSLTLVFSISATSVTAAENEAIQLPSSEAVADKVTDGAISSIRTVGSLFEGLEPVDSGDAFLDMRKKSRITNFAGGNVSFLLRSGFTVLARPSILVNASADCFSHFRTPMDFENVVLETMAEAQSPSRWMARLGEKMKKVSGGDFTMTIACYGFEDFDDMKKYYSMRLIRLQNDYINMQAGADGKILKQLWDKYKSVYYRNPLKREY